jgi:hypothetical protein
MPMRFIIVCEGESEWTYLQRLQGFLDKQELPPDIFEAPLIFTAPRPALAKSGSFGKMTTIYKETRSRYRNTAIHIWVDFDLYHRNDQKSATHYAAKAAGIPDFHFSFHNFEDFYALHFDGVALRQWQQFGGPEGKRHFDIPQAMRLRLNEYSPVTPKPACLLTLYLGQL